VSHSRPSHEDEREDFELTPPGEGFDLYRHRKAGEMRTKGWYGCYWASFYRRSSANMGHV
jgi:hypothetical protein